MVYECRCHRQMGNEFWFLPTGRCLFNKEGGCLKHPGNHDPCTAKMALIDDPEKYRVHPRSQAFRAWLASEHPSLWDEFFCLNGRFRARAIRSWAGFMGRLKWRRMFAEARDARVNEALLRSLMVGW